MSLPVKHDRKLEFGILIILFLSALAVRLPFINTHPPGLWYDEAINGLDGLSVIGNFVKAPDKIPVHGFPIFFTTEGHPREPMFMYLVGIMFLIIKPSIFSLRITSILVGAATAPVFYMFVRSGGRNRRLALIAALVLLTMRWHIHNSRVVLRVILLPFWMSLSFWGVLEAVKRQKRIYYIMAGLVFGMGFYTHLSFRFAPIILGIYAFYLFRIKVLVWRRDRKNLALFCMAAFLIFLPLGIDYLKNPFHLFGRMKEVSLFEQGMASGFVLILKNILSTLLMFSFRGDQNPYLNIPGMPVLNPIASIFFYWGIYICIRRIKDPFCFMLFPWFFFMLLGTILSTESPHFSRSFGACVPVVIFIACGLSECYEWAFDFLRKKRALLVVGIFWLFIATWDISLYYGKYRGDPRIWYRTNANFTEVAQKAVELAKNNICVYLPKDIYRHPTVKFITIETPGELVKEIAFPEVLSGADTGVERDHAVLATQFNMLELILQKEIPSGKILAVFRQPEGKPWAIFYYIPRFSLLPKKQTEEIFRRFQPDTQR
jgi:4-amino-4-deoxy-L-arabinose transferase-like glycosyltransferase